MRRSILPSFAERKRRLSLEQRCRQNQPWRLEVEQRLKTGSEASRGFFELLLARIFFIRYTDFESLIRYNVVRTLTYEKYTTVLCQPVSQRRRFRHWRHRGV